MSPIIVYSIILPTYHPLARDQHHEKWNSQNCLSSALQQNQCSSKFLDWNAPCWSAQWQRGDSQVAASEGLDEGGGEMSSCEKFDLCNWVMRCSI